MTGTEVIGGSNSVFSVMGVAVQPQRWPSGPTMR